MTKGKGKNTYTSYALAASKSVVEQTKDIFNSENTTKSNYPLPNYLFTYNKSVVASESTIEFSKNKSEDLFTLMSDLLNVNLADEQNSFSANVNDMFFYYQTIENAVKDNSSLTESLNQILELIKKSKSAHFENCDFVKNKLELSYTEYKKIMLSTKYVSVKVGNGQTIGAYVESCVEESENKQKWLNIRYKYIYFNGKQYYKYDNYKYVSEFKYTIPKENFEILPITPEEIFKFHNRGKLFHTYTKNGTASHMHYDGTMIVRLGWWEMEVSATGRIMIDIDTHKHLFPNEYSNNANYYSGTTHDLNRTLSYFDYCMLPPNIQAFSFETKRWGKIDLEKIKPIVWDDSVFDKLVLEKTKKNILRTLILNSKNNFKDIVKEKSGGCIFLLHGTPGTGKTLTAETISETLHKPLYRVTSGELGTDVIQLEAKLTQILEMMQRWDAIILIDEADVFLEKRNTENLARNAIVCVFLRILEKYDGIMFLTTNRKTELDHAFQSRISLVLEYNDLTYENRLKIWQSLLDSAGINLAESYTNEYAKYIMNGRNIKNIVRLAHSISLGNGEETNNTHFDEIFSLYVQEYKLTKENII